MDGFLGVLQAAVARGRDDAELAGAEAGERTQEDREGTGGAGSQSFESMMEKKKRLKLQEKMATMDKYERKRFELEHGMNAPLSGQQAGERSSGAKSEGDMDDGRLQGEPKHLKEGGSDQQEAAKDAQHQKGTGSTKRAAEDKIAAARERAKQRRMNQMTSI
jgi:hypothetical protein